MAKHSDKKPNHMLYMKFKIMDDVAMAFHHGIEKYGEEDWRNNTEDMYPPAVMRHLLAHVRGEKTDESGCSHIAHAIASLIIMSELE